MSSIKQARRRAGFLRIFLLVMFVVFIGLFLTRETALTRAAAGDTGSGNSSESKKGLIGYWKFDEGQGEAIKDSSDKNNNGTIKSPAKDCVKWVKGKHGFALEFTEIERGECGYVRIAGMNKYDFSKGLTIEVWIKTPQTGIPVKVPQGTILSNFVNVDSGPGFKFGSYANKKGDISELIFYTGSGKSITTHPNVRFEENTWYHLAVVCDGSTSRIYVDGEEIKVSGPGVKVTKGKNAMTIGSAGIYGFNGIIDEVKMYDYGRSASDILKDAKGFGMRK